MAGKRYEMTITATGEVRDADGNLVERTPVEAKVAMTEDQAAQLSKALFDEEIDQ